VCKVSPELSAGYSRIGGPCALEGHRIVALEGRSTMIVPPHVSLAYELGTKLGFSHVRHGFSATTFRIDLIREYMVLAHLFDSKSIGLN
jgi:hypothetical protein